MPTTAKLFAAYNSNYTNFGADWNAWNSGGARALPTVEANANTSGDPWAATSGHTGLNYVSMIIIRPSDNYWCIGIAAADSAGVFANTWLGGGAKCINSFAYQSSDGPAIAFDPGGTTLWAVATGPSNIYVMPNCTGAPGGPSCTVTASNLVDSTIVGHQTVAVNPCTGHAIVAYRNSNWDVKLKFFTTSGASTGANPTLHPHMIVAQNSHCPPSGDSCAGRVGGVCKCTGAGSSDCGKAGCIRQAQKVQVVTDTVAGSCYAYVSYDASYTNILGWNYMQAMLDVVDITDESALITKASWAAGGTRGVDNTWNGTVGAHSGGIAWFYYRQGGPSPNPIDPCKTYEVVATDENSALTNLTYHTVSGPFPTVNFGAGSGMSDYTRASSNMYSFFETFSVWVEPVLMQSGSPTCFSCQGNNYSSRVMGTLVYP